MCNIKKPNWDETFMGSYGASANYKGSFLPYNYIAENMKITAHIKKTEIQLKVIKPLPDGSVEAKIIQICNASETIDDLSMGDVVNIKRHLIYHLDQNIKSSIT